MQPKEWRAMQSEARAQVPTTLNQKEALDTILLLAEVVEQLYQLRQQKEQTA